ncbi:MAG: hypothetical protein DMF89_09520 [Acidobacteria bacterium]|nr:MAG: hypothetical protein DMF89_09520 [Acidobacteriota bacterium]
MGVVRSSRVKTGKRSVYGAPVAPLTTEAHPAKKLTQRVALESRTERRRREIFEWLVEAARQLMFSRYLDEARVQDITDLADVGKGTFFNFFSTKELVIPEVLRERIRLLRQLVDRVKAGQASSREALNYLINTGLDRGLTPADWRNYFGSYVISMAHDERVRSGVSDLIRETQQLVRCLVSVGQERGEFRNDRDASDLAIYLLHALFGLQLIAWVHGVGLNSPELESNARSTFDLLLCPPSSINQARKVARSPIASSKRPQSAHTKRKRRSRGGSH